MLLFEIILLLLLSAVVLAGVARRTGAPYPALLALAGAGMAFWPAVPDVHIEPDLALALFIAPVLLDAAFDTSPRDLRRNAVPLISLVLVATLVTTAVVAWFGMRYAGLSLAAAVALGAIVSPPDAAAATAILGQLRPPRALVLILQGESLFNDAVALLLYRLAVIAVGAGGLMQALPWLAIAALLSPPAGWLLAKAYQRLTASVRDPASATVLQFVATFGVWLLAERLGLSAIVTMVIYAITLAQADIRSTSARNRISSYAVWETVIFVLNVLAFMLMGLQARVVLTRLPEAQREDALWLGGGVLLTVVLVRLGWVLLHHLASRYWHRRTRQGSPARSARASLLIGWCGMRGLVTLATAFALPEDFPGRDVIVLVAFIVVFGTLVLQGLTLRPLMALLRLREDDNARHDLSRGRVAMLHAGIEALGDEASPEAESLRREYQAAADVAAEYDRLHTATVTDGLRLKAIAAQRQCLQALRRRGEIGDDAFRLLREELDFSELDAAPAGHFQPLAIEGEHPAQRRESR